MVRLPRYLARTISCSALAVSSHVATLDAQAPSTGVAFPPSLVTSGQAEEKVTPDRVSVLVNVQTRAATAAAAAADNARRTRAVLDALAALGLSKDQLSTEGYTAYPEMNYDRPGNTPKVIGYVVTNSVRAESKRVPNPATAPSTTPTTQPIDPQFDAALDAIRKKIDEGR